MVTTGHQFRTHGSSRSRAAPPRRLKARTVAEIAIEGQRRGRGLSCMNRPDCSMMRPRGWIGAAGRGPRRPCALHLLDFSARPGPRVDDRPEPGKVDSPQ